MLNLSDYASRMVHAFARLLETANNPRTTAVGQGNNGSVDSGKRSKAASLSTSPEMPFVSLSAAATCSRSSVMQSTSNTSLLSASVAVSQSVFRPAHPLVQSSSLAAVASPAPSSRITSSKPDQSTRVASPASASTPAASVSRRHPSQNVIADGHAETARLRSGTDMATLIDAAMDAICSLAHQLGQGFAFFAPTVTSCDACDPGQYGPGVQL